MVDLSRPCDAYGKMIGGGFKLIQFSLLCYYDPIAKDIFAES